MSDAPESRPVTDRSGRLPLDAADLAPGEIERRFRWGRRRGHPSWVWPHVSIAAWRAALVEVERAASQVLSDPDGLARLTPPSDVSAEALGVAAFTSGLGPLLGHWAAEGSLEAPPDIRALLRLHLEHGRLRETRIRRELGGALDALSESGVPITVLKGAHTGAAHFPAPGTRPAADVDLLVAPADAEEALRVLRAAGHGVVRRQERPARWELLPPGEGERELRSLALTHGESPWTLDLHTSLERDFFGIRRVELLPGDPRRHAPCPEVHPEARGLPQPLLTAFLALHASEGLHNLTLLRLVELVLVIRRDRREGSLEWRALAASLEEAGGLRFAAPALELAERLVPGTLDPSFRERLRASMPPGMRREMAGLRPAGAQRMGRLSLAERFLWASGPVEHVKRALYMLWPGWLRGSPGKLARTYVERLWRLGRGRVDLGSGPDE